MLLYMPMKRTSQESQKKATHAYERRNVPLHTKLLGGAALALALAGGIIGGVGHSRSSTNHNQAAHTQLLTEAQLEQGYAQVGKQPIVAPDGKAEFVVASPIKGGGQMSYDLFVSTDNGSKWQEIAQDVGQAGASIDATSIPAVWSPTPANGQDVLAVLRQNTAGVPDPTGSVLPEYVDLYAVGPHGAQRVAEAETDVTALQYNFGVKDGLQNMYSWGQQGNRVTFTLDEAVGGQNPNGTYWEGGMQAGQIQAQIPPAD